MQVLNKAIRLYSVIPFLVLFIVGCKTQKSDDSQNPFVYKESGGGYYLVKINDSIFDVYALHPNGKLRVYGLDVNGAAHGKALNFREDGTLNGFTTYRKGRKNGIEIKFYPSGNLEHIMRYQNDSLRGYFVGYYDAVNCIEKESMASPVDEYGYWYRRTYDSLTQEVIDVTDVRVLAQKDHPQIKLEDLRLPWESEDWYKKQRAD